MPKITLENVTKLYRDKTERRKVVGIEDVDLTIQQGEFVFVIGSSGAGKSTLLELMTGHIRPDGGRVCIGDRDLQRLLRWSGNQAARLFGQVWQNPMLIRKRTVEENLLLTAKIGARRRENGKQAHERAQKVLALVGMTGMEKKYPGEMSIGECRRVELGYLPAAPGDQSQGDDGHHGDPRQPICQYAAPAGNHYGGWSYFWRRPKREIRGCDVDGQEKRIRSQTL
jgi:cell division transport system ATP-binding protein